VVDAAPDLLVDVKPTRIGACSISGCAARYATAPMISATPALSSAPSSVVPSVVTMSCPTRAARIGFSAARSTLSGSRGRTMSLPSHSRTTCGSTLAPDSSWLVSICAIRPHGRPGGARERREHVPVLCQLGVLEPELVQLSFEQGPEVALLRGARVRLESWSDVVSMRT
jgi:hypothetical protein